MSEEELYADAVTAGALARAEILKRSGGLLSAGQAAAILRLTKREVKDMGDDGRLLALQPGYQFPAFQFDRKKGVLVAGLDRVLNDLKAEPAITTWAKCLFLLSPRHSLGGATPLVFLQRGKTAKVVALAGAYAS